jgi:hypothetical protein
MNRLYVLLFCMCRRIRADDHERRGYARAAQSDGRARGRHHGGLQHRHDAASQRQCVPQRTVLRQRSLCSGDGDEPGAFDRRLSVFG